MDSSFHFRGRETVRVCWSVLPQMNHIPSAAPPGSQLRICMMKLEFSPHTSTLSYILAARQRARARGGGASARRTVLSDILADTDKEETQAGNEN